MPQLSFLILLLVGCDGSPDSEAGSLRVFAASSLTDVFTELARELEVETDGIEVTPSFAGSQVLRLQIEQGAPADVFASADRSHLRDLEAQGLVDRERVFARNELVVIVPIGPSEIESFEDLPNAERLVIGDEAVPIGRYTRRLLTNATETLGEEFVSRVRSHVVSEENNVRLVRAKVELGEADAAIVYRSDAATSSRVRAIELPPGLGPTAEYHIGLVTTSTSPELGRRWLDYVAGESGRRVLASHGFVPVP
jgi:molybdate transport system substrate-binding protein